MLNKIIAETLGLKERFNTAMLKLTRGTDLEPLMLKKLTVTEAQYLQKFLDRLEILKAKKKQVEAMPVSILVQTYTRMLTQFMDDVKKTLCLDASYNKAQIALDGLLLTTNDPGLASVLSRVAQQYGENTAQEFKHMREIHTHASSLENGSSLPEFGRVFIAQDLTENKKAEILIHENAHLNFYNSYAALVQNMNELILSIESWEALEETYGQTADYFRDGYFRFDMIPFPRLLNELYAHLQEFLYVVRFQLDTADIQQLRTIVVMSKELMGLIETVAEEFAPEVAEQVRSILQDIRKLEIELQNRLSMAYGGKGDNALLNLMAVVLTAQEFSWLDKLFLLK